MTVSDSPTEPRRAPRMAEIVAEQLRRRIVTGDLQDGDELPREAELIREFGVSRPSLREAVRILETEGLLRIRRGKIGGAVVKRPTARTAAYHMGLALQYQQVTLDDLAEARNELEPVCAALAAGAPDEERARIVEALREVIDESETVLEDPVRFTATALRFHAQVVELCGNTTVTLMAGALEAVWSSQERLWASRASAAGGYPELDRRRDVVRAHRRIADLIAAGDVDAAARTMRAHIGETQPYVDYDDTVIEVIPPDR